MKIAIGNLQNQLFSEVDSSAGKNILGGNSIKANFEVSASANNSKGLIRGFIFGSGDDLFADLTAELQTGKGFSKSRSSVTITAN